ncbi:Hemolysin-related protein RbmC [Minicystis rosea]|nr:Hemolysin-related protein RbmC [Minicystis rosea]
MRRRRFTFPALAILAVAAPLVPIACGSGGNTSTGTGTFTTSGTGGHGGGDTVSSSSTGNTGGGLVDGGGCTSGKPCGDGGVCAGNTCCDPASACGDTCCAGGDVCSFQKCVTPGAPCHDSIDCGSNDYCEYSLGDNSDAGSADASCMGGAAELNGKCLPRPPTCAADAGAPDGGALDCLTQCEYHPQAGFNPVLKFAWGGQVTAPYATDVMMTPIVIELDDDDCDGKITEKDIPEIVFSTFTGGAYQGAGVLHAVSIVGGKVVDKWNVPGVINATKQLAGGNIDGQPGNEVVACGVDGAAHAFTGAGNPLWTSPAVTCMMPSIADLDGDGAVEVIVEGGILDGATGALKHAFNPPLNGTFVVSDIDGDGKLDIVTSSRGYHDDGNLFVDTKIAATGQFDGTPDWKSPWPAIGDFDKDGKPEIAVIDNLAHTISVWRYDAAAPQLFQSVRAPIDINLHFPVNTCASTSWGGTHGGGPPTIADFDGDGVPDVGTAGGIGYVVFDGKKLIDPASTDPILWAQPTVDCSSASTGSSVFDFDGDGKAEVVYSDQNHLRIYDGKTGDVLISVCNTTATLIEYPVIADVDNDGHADILVVSNAYGQASPDLACNDGTANAQSGVRIFGDANNSWVRTRRVWNEHAYHVTNVNEDGSIPAHELPNWTQPGLNDFRQNKQPGSEFSAPDVVVSVAPRCTGSYALVATVRNIGQAALPAGVVVGFYEGTPPGGTSLGQGTTTKVLYPAESEAVVLPLASPSQGIINGSTPVYVVVDDGAPAHPSWHECRTDNNIGGPNAVGCSVPQ